MSALSCACAPARFRCTLGSAPRHVERSSIGPKHRRSQPLSSHNGPRYSSEQLQRLLTIHERLIEARRELDALIGDAYLRPRANIVPVHFLDLASAVEKLRWAEKEWRELDREVEAAASRLAHPSARSDKPPVEHAERPADGLFEVAPAESSSR